MAQQQSTSGFTISDGYLLFCFCAFGHSCLQKMFRPTEFMECHHPIHFHLVVSYMALLGLRIPHYVRKFQLGGGDEAGVGKSFPKTILKGAWYALAIFFTVWTIAGSIWFADVMEKTPTCLPVSVDRYLITAWNIFCYLWVVIYTVCVALAYSLRQRQDEAESNLREVESDDTRARWGSVSAQWGMTPSHGLKPKEISSLPSCQFCEGCEGCEQECAICLLDFQEGDMLRRIPGCGHHFHQACIDLWLLRQNKCPLCKGDAIQQTQHSSANCLGHDMLEPLV